MSDINEREYEAEVAELNNGINTLQKENAHLHGEKNELRKDLDMQAREITTLSRALDAACAHLQTVEDIICPGVARLTWEPPEGCVEHCIMDNEEFGKGCWKQYFMEVKE